jgi:hypothetical protein
MKMPKAAKAYIAVVIAAGGALLLGALALWSSDNYQQFAIYLGLAVLASTLKIRMPGAESTMSPNFVFVLLAMSACTFSQIVVISFAAALVQSLWASAKRPRLIQVAFSAATLILSASVGYEVSHVVVNEGGIGSSIACMVLAGSLYFPLNAALVSMVIAMAERRPLKPLFLRCCQWSFLYFMGGILFAGLMSGAYERSSMWKAALALVPAVTLAHLYFLHQSTQAVPVRSESSD